MRTAVNGGAIYLEYKEVKRNEFEKINVRCLLNICVEISND